MNYPQPLATAVPITELPTFYRIYLVEFRWCFCCYNPYFIVEKKNGNWIIKKHHEEKSFTIPASKNIKQLNDILIMIGLENKMMKMKVVQEERTIKTKFFFNLNSLFNHIIFTEKSLEGVLYIK